MPTGPQPIAAISQVQSDVLVAKRIAAVTPLIGATSAGDNPVQLPIPDVAPPSILLQSPGNGAELTNNQTITWSVGTDSTIVKHWIEYANRFEVCDTGYFSRSPQYSQAPNTAAPSVVDGMWRFVTIRDGGWADAAFTFHVEVADAAGNRNHVSWNFTVSNPISPPAAVSRKHRSFFGNIF